MANQVNLTADPRSGRGQSQLNPAFTGRQARTLHGLQIRGEVDRVSERDWVPGLCARNVGNELAAKPLNHNLPFSFY